MAFEKYNPGAYFRNFTVFYNYFVFHNDNVFEIRGVLLFFEWRIVYV